MISEINEQSKMIDDTEYAYEKSQALLQQVRQAIEYSERKEIELQLSIKKTWNCTRQELDKKISSRIGEPTQKQLFDARQIMQNKYFEQEHDKQDINNSRFFVSNPI